MLTCILKYYKEFIAKNIISLWLRSAGCVPIFTASIENLHML